MPLQSEASPCHIKGMAHSEQDLAEMRAERERLQDMLQRFEAGKVTEYDEDDRGHLTVDVTLERIARLREQILDLDRTIAEDW